MSGKMMRDLSDAVDEMAAWAEKGRGKGFVLRAADNNADPAKVCRIVANWSIKIWRC